jgi:integrase
VKQATQAFDAGRITPRTTVGALAELWRAELRGRKRPIGTKAVRGSDQLSTQTITRYLACLDGTVLPEIGQLELGELTPGRLRKFIKSLAKKHLSEARIVRVVLTQLLSMAIEEDAVAASLVSFEGVRLAVPTKEARALSEQELTELRRLIQTRRDRPRMGPRSTKAEDDLRDLLDLMLVTGLRIGEALGVISQAIATRPDGLWLLVERGVVYDDERGYVLDTLKTRDSEKAIKLPPWIAPMLERRQRGSISGLLFETTSGTPLSPNNVRRTLRAAVAGTDLEWFSPHASRKTFATEVSAKYSAPVAQEVLRHKSISITEGVYTQKAFDAPDVTDVTKTFAP